MERKKINLFNIHFAYVNIPLLSELQKKNPDINIIDYIKYKSKQQFNIEPTSVNNVKKLIDIINDSVYYDNTSDWLKDCMRKDLHILTYEYYIDDMICLNDVKTEDDIKELQMKGYNPICTVEQFKEIFPLLDTSKVYFDNTILKRIYYYDSDKYAITEINIGYPLGAEKTYKNLHIITPPDFDKSQEEAVLMRINYIYDSLQKEEYEWYTFQNAPFYRNEIIDRLIADTNDENTKLVLENCKNIE